MFKAAYSYDIHKVVWVWLVLKIMDDVRKLPRQMLLELEDGKRKLWHSVKNLKKDLM